MIGQAIRAPQHLPSDVGLGICVCIIWRGLAQSSKPKPFPAIAWGNLCSGSREIQVEKNYRHT
jgi:hypothetical protein